MLNEQDLRVARKVLTGEVGLDQLAKKYTSREGAVVAVVILHAVGEVTFARRIVYEDLLGTLCIEPALRFDKYGQEDLDNYRPGIRFSSDSLFNRTKKLGLYKSSGSVGRGELLPQPLIDELLQDEHLKAKARQLYDTAMAARQARQKSYDEYVTRARKVYSELQGLDGVTVEIHYPFPTFDQLREQLRRALAIIDKYFPET